MKPSEVDSAQPETSAPKPQQDDDDARRVAIDGNEAAPETADSTADAGSSPPKPQDKAPKQKPGEIGGPQGPEPTRYGDWEVGGRCSDF